MLLRLGPLIRRDVFFNTVVEPCLTPAFGPVACKRETPRTNAVYLSDWGSRPFPLLPQSRCLEGCLEREQQPVRSLLCTVVRHGDKNLTPQRVPPAVSGPNTDHHSRGGLRESTRLFSLI